MVNDFLQWAAIGLVLLIVFSESEYARSLSLDVLELKNTVNKLLKDLRKLGD